MEARTAFSSMSPNSQDVKNSGTTDSETSDEIPHFVSLDNLGSHIKGVLQEICHNSLFPTKYEVQSQKLGAPYIYAYTTMTSAYKFSIEVFPKIAKPSKEALAKGPEEFTFDDIFETAIARYTKSRAKPNTVLRETRSTDFCYPVTVTIEAVPVEKTGKPTRILLLREFQILVRIWEAYRNELNSRKISIDHLVGFPMPFEFCIVRSANYDVPRESTVHNYYYGPNGAPTKFPTGFRLPLTTSTCVDSTLSYLATEKLGPSVSYLMDLMKSQSKPFSLSSALMIYDQLLCRLAVLHRYGVIHGDLNTNCLKFGSGNACNVLYLSDFSASIVLPIHSAPMFSLHDRFSSALKFKDQTCHFVHDLESAYYIFLLLAIGCLPWDSKLKSTKRISEEALIGRRSDTNPTTDQSNTAKDKEAFWDSSNMVQRLINSKEFDIRYKLQALPSLYQNFAGDVLMSIYTKVRDTVALYASIPNEHFLTNMGTPGTPASNAYLGIRKIIASYFRFETMSAFLKDPTIQLKVDMLKLHDPDDQRVAWDLSSWCWNCISVDNRSTTTHQKSSVMHMSTGSFH